MNDQGISYHPHRPSDSDPERCAAAYCGLRWDDDAHNPAQWLQDQAASQFLNPEVPTEDIVNQMSESDDVHAQMAQLLGDWWLKLAKEEVSKVVPKAVEYGALDLIDIGQDLARTAGRQVSDEEAAEMGIYFYIRGKLARWTDALVRGDRPSSDTLHDLGVYVRMAQRVRAAGSWPGV